MSPQDPTPASDRRSRARTARAQAARQRREEKAAARRDQSAHQDSRNGHAVQPAVNGVATDSPSAEISPPTASFYATDHGEGDGRAESGTHGSSPRPEQPRPEQPSAEQPSAEQPSVEQPSEDPAGVGDTASSFAERLAAASQAATERVAQVRAEAQKHAHAAAQQRTRADEVLETARIEADQLLKSAQADRARAAEELAEAERVQQANSEAHEQAESILANARAEAEQIRVEAREAADARLQEVEQTAMEWLAAAETEAERIARASFEDTTDIADDPAPGEVGDQTGQAAPSKSGQSKSD